MQTPADEAAGWLLTEPLELDAEYVLSTNAGFGGGERLACFEERNQKMQLNILGESWLTATEYGNAEKRSAY